MTTAERLRKTQWPLGYYDNLCIQAADELDQRDDTIAQLRAERDTMAAQIEGLKRGWDAEAKECADLKAKLAKREKDLESEVFERLQTVKELAKLREQIAHRIGHASDAWAEVVKLRAEIDALRATAQRRLELLRRHQWSGYTHNEERCPECLMLESEGHQDDCAWAAELNQNKPLEYTEPIHDHGAYGTAMKKDAK